jgi:hypothetical protein
MQLANPRAARRAAEGLPPTLTFDAVVAIATAANFAPFVGAVYSEDYITYLPSHIDWVDVESLVWDHDEQAWFFIADDGDEEFLRFTPEGVASRTIYSPTCERWAEESHAQAWPMLPGIRALVAARLGCDVDSQEFHRMFNEISR